MRTQVATDWTCRGHSSRAAKKVIDRFAHSGRLTSRHIKTHGDITATNHRPVESHILTSALINPSTGSRKETVPLRRLAIPKRAKAGKQFGKMNDYITASMSARRPPATKLDTEDDPAQVEALLNYCHDIFIPSCKRAFQRSKARVANAAYQPVQTVADRRLLTRKEALGRLIRAYHENREFALIQKDSAVALEDRGAKAKLRNDPAVGGHTAIIQELRKEKRSVQQSLRKGRAITVVRE